MSTPLSSPTVPSAAALPDDLDYLKNLVRELLLTQQELRQDLAQVRQQLSQLLKRLYGPRGERFHPEQLLLFADCQQAAESPAAAPAGASASGASSSDRPRSGHGRRTLPKHLRRETIPYRLTEAERLCPCCGTLRQEIGCDRTEQLDYQPASLFVTEHVQYRYACPRCHGQVASAAKPPQPLVKGLPGPGLLAWVVVSKYADHLPLYRQESIFRRQGVALARSTLCDWVADAATLLRPLYDEMKGRVLSTLVVHSDDTPLPVLDPLREHTRTGRLWIYLGDWLNPFNVFDYTPDRSQSGPQTFLAAFRGYLQADAYAGYDRVYQGQGVVEVACNAHARRKFFEAKESDPERAHRALAYYRELYQVEEQIREREAALRGSRVMTEEEAALFRVWWEEQVVLYRQEYALPVWLLFHAWVTEERGQVLPKSPLGEAMTYLLNQYGALREYLRQGFLAIDNNWAEREMRRVAIGRKNYLFAGSDAGGGTAAVLYSFLSSCQRHGLEPFTYLRDVFSRLATHPPENIAELLPDRWRLAAAAPPEGGPPAAAEEARRRPGPNGGSS
jgi:transposase